MKISLVLCVSLCAVLGSCYGNPQYAMMGTMDTHGQVVWTDGGSGADRDFSCFKNGQARGGVTKTVGHNAQNHYGGMSRSILAVKSYNDPNALARPTHFQWMWDDKGSGAREDGSVWRPMCPQGYGAVGDVMAKGYHDGSLYNEVNCVKMAYLKPCVIHGVIWNDKGSGANRDVEIYSIHCPSGVYSSHFATSMHYGQKPQTKVYGISNEFVLT